MTRFARAKGSKASNERVPLAATPWNVMKLELQKTQEEGKNKEKREQFKAERQKNYDNFVKETESKTEKKWADFPKPNLKTIKKKKIKNKNLLNITEKDVTEDMIAEMCQPDPEVDGQFQNMTKKIEKVLAKANGKKKKNDAPQEVTSKVSPQKIVVKKAKIKKQALKIAPIAMDTETPDEKPTPEKKLNQKEKSTPEKILDKKEKLKLKNKLKKEKLKLKKKMNLEENSTPEKELDLKEKSTPKKKLNKKQKSTPEKELNKKDKSTSETKFNKKDKKKPGNINKTKQKLPKIRDNLEHKRRKPFTEDKSIIINGEKQEITMYFGFPVLKSDHDRLVELRKSLISKGIPHKEVNKTMKLERRKCEKILSRTKKNVCFKCREPGHMLSDCPQLDDGKTLAETTATGICFKCGSTEHNYKECKVNKDFKYAKCFICKEQGHISNQCPDNPRGLYPKGGACKLCGDVTHLKKDCSKYAEEQKDNSVFLNIISSGNIEGIDDSVKSEKKTTPKKKVVKF